MEGSTKTPQEHELDPKRFSFSLVNLEIIGGNRGNGWNENKTFVSWIIKMVLALLFLIAIGEGVGITIFSLF